MGQQKITMEFTEQEARIVEYALERAFMVAPRQMRGVTFETRLKGLLSYVKSRVEGLKELPPARWSR